MSKEPIQNSRQALIKANLKSEADVDLFIKNYGQKNETLRILKTKKSLSENANTLVVKYFRCHHNTRHEATKRPGEVLASKPTWRFKNTNCPFSMVVRISRDAEHEDFPSTIHVEWRKWSHNHSVDSMHSFRFKDIPACMVKHIKEIYGRGLLPAAAYHEVLKRTALPHLGCNFIHG